MVHLAVWNAHYKLRISIRNCKEIGLNPRLQSVRGGERNPREETPRTHQTAEEVGRQDKVSTAAASWVIVFPKKNSSSSSNGDSVVVGGDGLRLSVGFERSVSAAQVTEKADKRPAETAAWGACCVDVSYHR